MSTHAISDSENARVSLERERESDNEFWKCTPTSSDVAGWSLLQWRTVNISSQTSPSFDLWPLTFDPEQPAWDRSRSRLEHKSHHSILVHLNANFLPHVDSLSYSSLVPSHTVDLHTYIHTYILSWLPFAPQHSSQSFYITTVLFTLSSRLEK